MRGGRSTGGFITATQTLLVMTAVPFTAVGAVWTLWLARFSTSIAVWVGMIALLEVAAETASVMVVYLDEWRARGGAKGFAGTSQLDDGVGADVAKRIAAPMWGGLVSLTILTLLVIPAAWVVWRSRQLSRPTRAV